MKSLTREQFSSLLKEQRIKTRLVRELRFNPDEITDWDDREMLAVGTRSSAEGLLLVQTDSFYVIPYELNTGIADKTSGRSKPITCDFCYTWQRGGNAARITFRRASDNHTFSYLCCGDLRCSLHVRNLTPESILSRTQLHEDITTEQRIVRHMRKLDEVILTLGAKPI